MADERFSALSTDPRYRLPSRKKSRTPVDPRFKRLFTDEDFQKKASVDRYGRKIKAESGKKELERLYRAEGEVRKGKSEKGADRGVVGSSKKDQRDVEDEELVERKDPAREGGFSDSSSEEESRSEAESEDEAELAEETAGQEQAEDIPLGEVSRRIAVVNLDWDNIRAIDIMAVAASFVPVDGKVESVTIYPSEFGRERLEREELEGPPREIFAISKRGTDVQDEDDEDEGDEEEDETIKRQLQHSQVNDGEEFDTAKLRQYQLERLRYYYAVIVCDTNLTGRALYDDMDGREYLSTANFFDLRFIPDSTSFEDDKPQDECRQLPVGYKPNDFRTEALTHSKVKLTWDDDDTTRKEVQKRAFSRAEMDDNDLQAYIGSDSSDAESVSSRKSVTTPEERKARKKEAQRAKMRTALGLAEEPKKSSSSSRGQEEVVGDMQITFTSGLGGWKEGKGSVFENEPLDEESTRDRYIRKERERKQQRKERMKASRGGETQATDGAGGGAIAAPPEDASGGKGFEDSFFTDPSASAALEKKQKKANKLKKLTAQQAEKDSEAAVARRAELDLLMAEDQADNVKHFDMQEIEKAQEQSRHKNKRNKKEKGKERSVAEDGFEVQTQDPRFKALFESHEFAIDPTNPRFKGTDGMKALLEEGRRKRRVGDHDEGEGGEWKKRKVGADGGDGNGAGDELKGLVKRLKGGKGRK